MTTPTPARPRPQTPVALGLTALEDRTVPAVTDWMSGTVLKIAGNTAADWVALDFSGDKVWYNATGFGGPKFKYLWSLSGIDVDGGSGVDTLEVLQTADANIPVRLFGGPGNDVMKIDVRSDTSAKYSADGGADTDTVSLPTWMADGPTGFPSRLWTNAEGKNYSPVAQAQEALRQNANMTSIWQQIAAPITSTPGSRSAAKTIQVIEQFELGYSSHARYQYDTWTKCNVAAGDICRALNVPLPTKRDLGLSLGNETAGCVNLYPWLSTPANGWRRVDINSAADRAAMLAAAKAGKPVLACTAVPNHIAVLRPDQTLTTLTTANLGDLVTAQAGSKNFNKGRLADVDGWMNIGLSNVGYFVRTAETPPPAAPGISLNFSSLGGGSYAFSWNDLPNETAYKVSYRFNGGGEWYSFNMAANTTVSTWSMPPGLVFEMKVSALDSAGTAFAISNTVRLVA